MMKAKHNLSAVGILFLLPLSASASEWDYGSQHGPDHWSEMNPDYVLCGSGRNQSPVNIVGTVDAELPGLVLEGETKIIRGVNNGHTVQFDFEPGSTLKLGKETFILRQVHFHTPSENHFGGREFPLEAHFVHSSEAGDQTSTS